MKNKEIYQISIEASSPGVCNRISHYLFECENVPLCSIKNSWSDGIVFNYQGSEEGVKKLLKILCSQGNISINYLKRKYPNWFHKLFHKEDK